jgi:glycosyltransferase involved in cell wall biosynthesis
LKIIQIIDTLSSGGSERMAVNISNALAIDKNEVMLITTRKSGSLSLFLHRSVEQHCLSKRHIFDVSAFMNLISLLNDYKPDIIHAHSSSVFWATLATLLSQTKAKIFWHDHNGNRPNISILKNLPYICCSIYFKSIMTVNEDLLKWSKRFTRVKRDTIVYLPNFPLLTDPSHKSTLKDSIEILNIANFREPKDHLNLIRAFHLLLQDKQLSSIKLQLTLVGNTNIDPTYTNKILTYIYENSLNNHVNLIGEANDVSGFIYKSSIGVISSTSEGLPVSLLEYGLAALPVVVTDVGQCAAVLNHGEFGKIVAARQPHALATALKEFILNPKSASEIGIAFRHHVETNYGSGQFLRAYYSLIKNA